MLWYNLFLPPQPWNFAVNLNGNAEGCLPGSAFSIPFCFPILSGALRHLHVVKLSPCKATEGANRNDSLASWKKPAISPSRPLPDLLKASARAAGLQHGTTCPPGTGMLRGPELLHINHENTKDFSLIWGRVEVLHTRMYRICQAKISWRVGVFSEAASPN